MRAPKVGSVRASLPPPWPPRGQGDRAGAAPQSTTALRFRMSGRVDFILRANADYIDEQHRRWLENPRSVPEDWALFFTGMDFGERRPHRGRRARQRLRAGARLPRVRPPGRAARSADERRSRRRTRSSTWPDSDSARPTSSARCRRRSMATSAARCASSSRRCARPIAARSARSSWTSPTRSSASGCRRASRARATSRSSPTPRASASCARCSGPTGSSSS